MNISDHDDVVPSEVGQLIEARSPHFLAVLTLVLGLLSFVALFHLWFVVVPLLTLAFGVSALRSLAANPEKIGDKAVMFGMVLAMFFGTWASVHYWSRQHYLLGIARNYADDWVELVRQKKKYEAYELHLSKYERAPKEESFEEFIRKEPRAQRNLDAFFGSEALRTILSLSGDVRIEFDRRTDYATTPHSDTVVLRYVATYEDKGRQRELPFLVVMKRDLDRGSGDYCWRVFSVGKG